MDLSRTWDHLQVDDALFAKAYGALGAARRSVLKKWIAQLYLFWGRNRQCSRSETISWDQGVVTTLRERPLDWGLVILSESFASPSQLLAVLMPMLLAGTRQVIVLRETRDAGSFPGPLLVAMELAGQETVLAATTQELTPMLELVPQDCGPWGKVCCLGAPALEPLVKQRMSATDVWCGEKQPRAGIWFDPDVLWDLETIDWTLQGTALHVGGAVPDTVSASCVRHKGPFETFINQHFGALYLPHPEDTAGLPPVSLFGPGQEGGWLWPWVTPQAFTLSTVAWHGKRVAKEETDGLS